MNGPTRFESGHSLLLLFFLIHSYRNKKNVAGLEYKALLQLGNDLVRHWHTTRNVQDIHTSCVSRTMKWNQIRHPCVGKHDKWPTLLLLTPLMHSLSWTYQTISGSTGRSPAAQGAFQYNQQLQPFQDNAVQAVRQTTITGTTDWIYIKQLEFLLPILTIYKLSDICTMYAIYTLTDPKYDIYAQSV